MVMSLHPLLLLTLHLIPFFLLIIVKQRTDLIVRRLVNLHHFGMTVLL